MNHRKHKSSRYERVCLLYCSFFRITALVVGGGLAMLPVIEEIFVEKKKLLSKEDLLDMITLTQSIPGIIAMNSAVFIGMKVAGVIGAIAAALGAVTPPFFVILLIASLFPGLDTNNPYVTGAFIGIRSGVTALISISAIKMLKNSVKCKFEASIIAIYFILAICHVRTIWLILSSIPLGCIYLYFLGKRQVTFLKRKNENKGA